MILKVIYHQGKMEYVSDYNQVMKDCESGLRCFNNVRILTSMFYVDVINLAKYNNLEEVYGICNVESAATAANVLKQLTKLSTITLYVSDIDMIVEIADSVTDRCTLIFLLPYGGLITIKKGSYHSIIEDDTTANLCYTLLEQGSIHGLSTRGSYIYDTDRLINMTELTLIPDTNHLDIDYLRTLIKIPKIINIRYTPVSAKQIDFFSCLIYRNGFEIKTLNAIVSVHDVDEIMTTCIELDHLHILVTCEDDVNQLKQVIARYPQVNKYDIYYRKIGNESYWTNLYQFRADLLVHDFIKVLHCNMMLPANQ